MGKRRSSGIIVALILILLGLWFLAVEFVPTLAWARGAQGWPLFIVASGVGLLLIGIATGLPGLAVPACIAGGIGGLLYWQNATGHWESWAYAWTLIPGFAGVGTMLMGLLRGRWREVGGGAWTVFVSLVLFAIFGSFLGGVELFGAYWPALLIILGVLLLGRAVLAPRPKATPAAAAASTTQAEPPLPPALQGES